MNCCVCNRAGSDVIEYPSTLTNKAKPYCLDCIQNGFEPYQDLIDFCFDFKMFNKTYQQRVVLPTLTLNQKTVMQFNEEIQKKRDELFGTADDQGQA